MEKLKVLLVLFLSTCHAVLSAITDGLLPNGDFEESPEPKYLLNGTVVKFDTAIPNWRISGIVEYIASPQKQFNNKLVAPQGVHSIKLVTGKDEDDDPGCGVLIDSVALKVLNPSKRTRGNLLKNGNFEEGPYISPNTSWGVDIVPIGYDSHIPIPGWIVENTNDVKYIDSDHFVIPEGKRAVELLSFAGIIALKQVVITKIRKDYELTFVVGDGKDACKGSMLLEVFAGKDSVQVPYKSKGKGRFIRRKLRFKAVSTRTNIRITSIVSVWKKDGTICGPIIDDVKLLPIHT
ncbi:hypothetical protein RIF29_28218 [Crotalaria pallida]|uniref:DUF642 domain-containing protein n=1 Tax=Crotalaria pallida TaxID=3830 RepID=A0AAN9I1R7_CROPI